VPTYASNLHTQQPTESSIHRYTKLHDLTSLKKLKSTFFILPFNRTHSLLQNVRWKTAFLPCKFFTVHPRPYDISLLGTTKSLVTTSSLRNFSLEIGAAGLNNKIRELDSHVDTRNRLGDFRLHFMITIHSLMQKI